MLENSLQFVFKLTALALYSNNVVNELI